MSSLIDVIHAIKWWRIVHKNSFIAINAYVDADNSPSSHHLSIISWARPYVSEFIRVQCMRSNSIVEFYDATHTMSRSSTTKAWEWSLKGHKLWDLRCQKIFFFLSSTTPQSLIWGFYIQRASQAKQKKSPLTKLKCLWSKILIVHIDRLKSFVFFMPPSSSFFLIEALIHFSG